MDKKSKVFFIFLGIAILLSAEVSFYRYIILKNYMVFTDESLVPASLDALISKE